MTDKETKKGKAHHEKQTDSLIERQDRRFVYRFTLLACGIFKGKDLADVRESTSIQNFFFVVFWYWYESDEFYCGSLIILAMSNDHSFLYNFDVNAESLSCRFSIQTATKWVHLVKNNAIIWEQNLYIQFFLKLNLECTKFILQRSHIITCLWMSDESMKFFIFRRQFLGANCVHIFKSFANERNYLLFLDSLKMSQMVSHILHYSISFSTFFYAVWVKMRK